MIRLDGKKTAEIALVDVENSIHTHVKAGNRAPGLAVILVGENPASQAYIRTKKRVCAQVRIRSVDYNLPDTVSETELIDLIESLNTSDTIDGILVQLPLPDHINSQAVIQAISPHKDVDGFHPYNAGHLYTGNPAFRPCTPYGIAYMLKAYHLSVSGKYAVVVGRSTIVGRPMAAMLMQDNATVTTIHSATKNPESYLTQADIIIMAIGKPHWLKAHMVKPGAIIIDVGINRVSDATTERGYRLIGDVDYDSVAQQASAITPVPGGVGPMTVAMLMHNTLQAYERGCDVIESAVLKFRPLIKSQLDRVSILQTPAKPVISETKTIGLCYGDGIGPEICNQAMRFLQHSLQSEIQSNRIQLKVIDGLTIENRARHKQAIPDDVLAELKSCDVILKGPTTTPQKGDQWPNIESANVAMRRDLDLYACIRPVTVPQLGIDWMIYRENTEGAYTLGSHGFLITPDLGIDFKITTEPGSARVIRAAFEYAKKTGRSQVSIVTKSNIIKTTDGLFSDTAKRIAQDYPAITCDEYYVDIMAANMINPDMQSKFSVIVTPNLYGDILSDLAAQLQGGVGTAGSANIGDRWAMFEAVHGSAPRMILENRSEYADPASMIKATQLLLAHLGYTEIAEKLGRALTVASQSSTHKVTGYDTGCTGAAMADYLMTLYENPSLPDLYQQCLS